MHGLAWGDVAELQGLAWGDVATAEIGCFWHQATERAPGVPPMFAVVPLLEKKRRAAYDGL